MGKLFAIGDIHGHYKQLMSLLYKIEREGFNSAEDTLVFLGDYIDGGPDSYKVVDWLMSAWQAYPHWVFLAGNHEWMMLDHLLDARESEEHSRPVNSHLFNHWYDQGGRATLKSYREGSETFSAQKLDEYQRALLDTRDIIPPSHIAWLSGLPLTHQTQDYVFVHAGLTPGIPLEAALSPTQRETHLWVRQPFLHSEWVWGKRVIFGHTPTKEAIVMPNKIGIDCMFHDHGALCAVELPQGGQRGGLRFHYAYA